MTNACITRTDQGGLAVQTGQLAAHLHPEHVLQVDLPAGVRRGDSYPDLHTYGASTVDVCRTDVIPRDQLVRLARKAPVLWAVECFYCPDSTWTSINAKTRTILIANPELYVRYPARTVVLPTMWEAGRIPGARVIPHPCDVEAVRDRRRARGGGVRTFLHVQAPAMLDRNGSNVVAGALRHVGEPCTLIVRSFQSPRKSVFPVGQVGNVTVVWDHRRVREWHEAYADDVDVLVMPRRYGGLSLIAQECATLGIPSLMSDLDPQRSENWPGWRTPTTRSYPHQMRGGRFDVYDTDPVVLAAEMTALVRGGRDLRGESEAALAWSEARTWGQIGDQWSDTLKI